MLQSALSSSSHDLFVDLLNLSDLQLLKGQKRSEVAEDPRSPQKRYVILTLLIEDKKYHYPLPLAPIDTTEVKLLDKDTIKFIIKNTSKKLTTSSVQSRTAQSFFSAENTKHPQVAENRKLRQKLEMLKQLQETSLRPRTPADSEMSLRNLQL